MHNGMQPQRFFGIWTDYEEDYEMATTALVTTSGIGRAVANKLAELGVHVVAKPLSIS